MIRELYELFNKKTGVILNKVPFDFLPLENLERRLEPLQLPIVEAIPCSCDILSSEGAYFFTSKKPNHVFTKTLQKIVTRIK